MFSKSSIAALEKQFWAFVEHNEGEDIKVEYAADLPYDKYGIQKFSGDDSAYEQHPWNLNKLHNKKNSLLQFCGERPISGITMSWIYIGMLFSSFCWHYEDIMMYSVNYMHEGAGKIWYAIPEYHREKFERIAKEKLALLFDKDPNLLHNINVMINPAFLVENDIHVYRTHQKPGEIILTFPEAYHQGVSMGFNIAEAVNLACPTWIKHGQKAMSVYLESKEKIPVFPMEWMLVENARQIDTLKFDQEALLELYQAYSKYVEKELSERALVASHFEDKERFETEVQKYLEDREGVDEDKFECFYCVNLCYTSFIKCLSCGKHYCIAHELLCGCRKDRIRMVLRYSNDELLEFQENLKKQIILL